MNTLRDLQRTHDYTDTPTVIGHFNSTSIFSVTNSKSNQRWTRRHRTPPTSIRSNVLSVTHGGDERLDLHVDIHMKPNEVRSPIRFDQDEIHRAYDQDFCESILANSRSGGPYFQGVPRRFIGKCSPVHFFWGALDLAVTRFSGRRSPIHPGGIPNLPDRVTRDAYSHEVSSCGFWPGGGAISYPAFYSYAYPEPDGFSKATC